MPVECLPGDAQLFTQITHLGFRLPHGRHSQAQLGSRHLERSATFPATRTRRSQPSERPLGNQLSLELGQCREDPEKGFGEQRNRKCT